MNEVLDFLKDSGVFYIATIDGDKPRVRPFGAVNIFEGKLYLQTGKVKKVSKQIDANPNVEVCAFNKGKWIRLEGKLVKDERKEAKEAMLDAFPDLKKMYSADDDNTEVLYFEDGVATICSFTDKPKVIKF